MSRREPFDEFLCYALPFMRVSVDERKFCFVFKFEPASTTPFSTSQNMSLIESIKIFGLVRMQLATFIDLKNLTPQNKQLIQETVPSLDS